MPKCDEDGCKREAIASCPACAYMACDDHCGGDGSECPECGKDMEGLG